MTPDPTQGHDSGVTFASIMGLVTAGIAQIVFALKEWKAYREKMSTISTQDRLVQNQEDRLHEMKKHLDQCLETKAEIAEVLLLVVDYIPDLPDEIKKKIFTLTLRNRE
jgi:hypothetical protein